MTFVLFQDCLHETFRNSLPLHGMVVEEDRTSIENSGSSTGSYNIVTIDGNWRFHFILDFKWIKATRRPLFLDLLMPVFMDQIFHQLKRQGPDF